MKTTTKVTSLLLLVIVLIVALNVLTFVGCQDKNQEDTFVATTEQEFFYNDYNAKSNADTSRQNGVDTFENKDIVFDAVTYEELIYLLQQEGNYLILLGGSWCHNTRAAATYINQFAHQYGITKIYNFDFYLDGESS